LIDSEQGEDSAQFDLVVQEEGSAADAVLKYLVDTFTSAYIRARRKRKPQVGSRFEDIQQDRGKRDNDQAMKRCD